MMVLSGERGVLIMEHDHMEGAEGAEGVAEGGVKLGRLARLAGLFTSQDLVRRVISRGRGLEDTLVRRCSMV